MWEVIGTFMGLVACGSSLPPGAEPVGALTHDRSYLVNADEIAYRVLTREDFKAKSPPPHADEFAKRLGAVTCASVRATDDTSFLTQSRGSGFETRVTRLGFIARMDRNCSWWNPEPGVQSEAYTLQHEQTHFAIVEVEARRLHGRAPELKRELQASGSSQKESQRNMERQVEGELRELLERVLDRSLEFDEDTSGKDDTTAQQRWYDTLMRELRELGG